MMIILFSLGSLLAFLTSIKASRGEGGGAQGLTIQSLRGGRSDQDVASICVAINHQSHSTDFAAYLLGLLTGFDYPFLHPMLRRYKKTEQE